ncbi:MAG: Transcriptional regulator, MarR family [Parcubacteria group bacterium GW2011_GWC2_39_14]|nr:MAG: Transcriptional regulator, MarR family [Parcubacteria group bacterium GW2011_GWC2_39_14]KKR55451.1 MAG: Transcriptional regulator, MarR family [Parcubacteria group bacterium GW2011_GWA2_40_23]
MSTQNTEQLIETIFNLKRLIFSQLQKTTQISAEKMIQFEALSFINSQEKTRMKDLARLFGITPPSITCFINKLEDKKLLSRKHEKQDRRNVYLELTKTGKKFLETTQKNIKSKMINFLSPLNEKDKKDLINIYQKLFKHYERL